MERVSLVFLPAQDYVEQTLDLNELCIADRLQRSLCVLKVIQ